MSRAGYEQREFIGDEFGDVLAAASLVVSRAGANTVYEMLVTRKPHLLIPLGRDASRGDQMDNAKTFSDAGYSTVIQEDALSNDVFLEAVRGLHRRADGGGLRRETLSAMGTTPSPGMTAKGLAEREGFEPSIRCRIHAFQACSFNRSDTSPEAGTIAGMGDVFNFRY